MAANDTRSQWLAIASYAAALALVAAVTAVYFLFVRVNATTVALTFLLAVLAVATTLGLGQAVTASFAAMFCFNYFFLPPMGTLTIEDPQNWVALAAFLVTAIVASQLSAGIRKRAMEAIQRRAEMERLYTLSRAMMLAETGPEAAKHIAALIAQVFETPAVMIYDKSRRSLHRAGPQDAPVTESRLQDVALQDTPFHDAATNTSLVPMRLGGGPLGAMAISGTGISDTALNAVANLAAIALERASSLEAASQAEAARESEQLKSTLLDALAHEFKTPLTAIKAAATGLLTDAELKEPQVELLTVINEESDRLNSMVTDAIRVARVEAGDVRVEKQPSQIAELVDQVLRRLPGGGEERGISVQVPPDLPRVAGDRELISVVIGHLLENALKYSPAGSPVAISARADAGAVILTVSDSGPGIAPEDRERVFQRFYRGPWARTQSAGTGMGLAIAREIVKLHGGRIWVEDSPGPGVRVSFSLPVMEEAVTE
jgi:two-component system sensor histidine kinase KdpD